jgi:putative transposase
MTECRYAWRTLTAEQRREVVAWRRERGRAWHAPPHPPHLGRRLFHVTAACYRHAPHIGRSPRRLDQFAGDLCSVLAGNGARTAAWCVLPNHYHVLIETPDIVELTRQLGRLHGRTSHAWNAEEGRRGRQVFHRAADRFMRSDRHVSATINYIHHNPVHHGYATKWTDWPWSSAADYLDLVGREEAARAWKEYPIRGYGRGWDDPGT